MADDTELRLLRAQIAAIEDDLLRVEGTLAGNARPLLVQTVSDGAYPSTAGVYYAVQRVTVTGPAKEGGTPSFDVDGNTFYAAHFGPTAPTIGTYALAFHVPNRWAFYH